jgi:hypothetical protein
MMGSNAHLGIRMHSQALRATTDALRGCPVKSAISPNMLPGSRVSMSTEPEWVSCRNLF